MVTVAALVGSFIAAPTIDGAQDRTDPTMSSSVDETREAETLSRSEPRKPLTSSSPTPSPTESASESESPSPEPVPAAAPSSEEAEPEPSESATPEFGDVIGAGWTTASVNVRSGPGTGFGVVTSLAEGAEVEVTNVVVDDRWQQVRVGERIGFISSKYLTDEEPSPEPSESEGGGSEEEAVDEGDVSTESCSAAASIESGLTERAVGALRAICNEFPNVTNYGGYRNDGDSYHSSGRAIDVMISGEAGWEVARWVRANASELGAIEVIYAQKIWTTQRSGEGWRSMPDRGSTSANHYDHVHVSIR